MVPYVALPPVTSFTVHVNGPLPPANTWNCCVPFGSLLAVGGEITSGLTTSTDDVAVNVSILAVIVATPQPVAVTVPSVPTVATEASLVVKVGVNPAAEAPGLRRIVAVSCLASPMFGSVNGDGAS